MAEKTFLGIDCGSVSLNLFVAPKGAKEPYIVYLRTRGRPLQTLIEAIDQTLGEYGDTLVVSAYVTGSARELIANATGIPAINEITAHTIGAHKINPDIRTIIEIGGQDSKYIRIEPSSNGGIPRVVVFRMNEICAAGTAHFWTSKQTVSAFQWNLSENWLCKAATLHLLQVVVQCLPRPI